MKKYILLIVFFIFSVSYTFASESQKSLFEDTKYQLLIQKAEKAEKNGFYDEAAEAYEEAFEYSNNAQPLLNLANLYCNIGLYDSAEKVVEQIPYKKLKKVAKSEVNYLKGKIYIAKGNLGGAYVKFNDVLKKVPNKFQAKIRLAMINLIKGMVSDSEKQLRDFAIDGKKEGSVEDYRISFAVDMYNANFVRAYKACETISKINSTRKGKNFFDSIINLPLFIFISFLPLFLSKYLSVFYYFVLFMALGICATTLCKKAKLWQIFSFVVAGIALLGISRACCISDVYYSLLNGYAYIYDEIWILPRIIIASHLMALAMFIIFPLFKILREDIRPVAYELLGIWLFCFFFGIFVLAFQSNLSTVPRFTYMIIGLVLSFFSTLIMPFGKILIFKLSSILGLSLFDKINKNNISKTDLSYSDLKILETKTWRFITKGEIDTAIGIGKKALTPENQVNFPSFWQAMILAQICNEDYGEANENISNYYQIFQGTDNYEVAQVYEALLKTEKGDFPTAYKIINAISADRARTMTGDESAISLLVIARCCCNLKDNVQAHQNYEKALNCVTSDILKFIILTDLIELDYRLKSREDFEKWHKFSKSIKCFGKSISYKNTIDSIAAMYEGNKDEAFRLASLCLKDKIKTSKSVAWLGHLFCLQGKPNEAEKLLSRMTAESYMAEKLMVEITSL